MANNGTGGSMDRSDADRRKFRVGLALFVVYVVGYTLFTLAGTFFKGVLMLRVGGVNLGIVSGMLIIVSAIAIALAYNWYAGKVEAG